MSDIYHTILSPSEGAYTDKRSKFLSFAFPVVSVEEARRIFHLYQRNIMMLGMYVGRI